MDGVMDSISCTSFVCASWSPFWFQASAVLAADIMAELLSSLVAFLEQTPSQWQVVGGVLR